MLGHAVTFSFTKINQQLYLYYLYAHAHFHSMHIYTLRISEINIYPNLGSVHVNAGFSPETN